MEKLLSIIIPVYNVELYLDRCLKSVLNQIDEQKIEILLIDDGSTDKSGAICDKYNMAYSCITAIHKKNSGLSEARNSGILYAHGNYLLFLDSDDQINENAIKKIIKIIESNPESDVFIGRYISVYEKKVKECNYTLNQNLEKFTGENFLVALLESVEHYDWYACLNIIKKEFLLSHKLFFAKNRCFEDALWTPQVLYLASKISVFNYPFYLYTRERKDSITCSFSSRIYQDKLFVCCFFKKFCNDKRFNIKTKKMIYGNLNLIYTSLLALLEVSKGRQKALLERNLLVLSNFEIF